MAIIKCPECGHQVSDKAPICPSCGVEIAGKVTRCPECGEIFFKEEAICPSCHRPVRSQSGNLNEATNTTQPAVSEAPKRDIMKPQTQEKPVSTLPAPKKKKGGSAALFVSFLIALLVCGICFYMYKNAQDRKELQEYEFATRSEDPLILQSYLDTYKDAPQAHIDAITAHLQQIKQNDLDWNNAYISNSKSMLTEYLLKHPDSPHKALAQQKIDSLDWAQASGLNTIEAYQAYLDEHQDGEHYNEAEENMKALKVKEVTPEEKSMINQLFRRFFISINERNQENLVSTVAEELTLLDKEQATPRDVVQMMEKMYKDDVTRLIWRINKDYNISKREVGDNRYEYSVSFTALKEEEHTDAANNKNSQYRINAKVNPNSRISELKMSKIVD
jgi:hypothetical protein